MTSSVVCDYTAAGWEVNSLNQNACQVYAELQGVCTPTFSIASVGATSPPYLPQDNACGCNVVAYNLMAGCGWCQSQILTTWWLTEAQWAGNCTVTAFDSTGIAATVSTASIVIPAWALILPTATTWDPSQAQLAAASASPSNTLATVFPTIPVSTDATSTPSGGGFLTIGDTSASLPTSSFFYVPVNLNSGSGSGNAPGIVLGVVFGLYALALIGVVAVYFIRQKKRQAWYGPMGQYYAGMRNGGGMPSPPLTYNAATPYDTVKTPMSGTSGATGYTNYQPPPPEQPMPTYGYGNATNTQPMYGGAPNTNSVYGVPPSGPPPGAANTSPAGYRGYAEAH